MTHEELLAKIDAKLEQCTCDGWGNNCFDDDNVPWLILRAVVELHKPVEGYEHLCSACWFGDGPQAYPCQTIQTIEKELV